MSKHNHEYERAVDSQTADNCDRDDLGGSEINSSLNWYRDVLLGSTILIVVLADQITKHIVTTTLSLGESWPIEGLFRITHGTNSGTAFGFFPSQTTLLIVASLFAIGFLIYFYRVHALPNRLLRLAIGLQLGGAFGNLIDRLRYGLVVDFIDVGWWPDFNLADSSIVVGITLLISILVLTKQPPSESKEESYTDRCASTR